MRCVKRNAKNSKRVIIKKFRSLFAVGFIMIAGVFVMVSFLPWTREQFNAEAEISRRRAAKWEMSRVKVGERFSLYLPLPPPSFLFHLMLGRHHRSAPEDSLPGDQGPPPRSYTMDSVDPWITDLSIKNSVCSVSYRLCSRCSLFRTPP